MIESDLGERKRRMDAGGGGDEEERRRDSCCRKQTEGKILIPDMEIRLLMSSQTGAEPLWTLSVGHFNWSQFDWSQSAAGFLWRTWSSILHHVADLCVFDSEDG